MRVHWCMLGATALLLLGEIAISQLCTSLITMIDGFHTIIILIHVTLLHPQTLNITQPVPPPLRPDSASPQSEERSSSPAAPSSGLPFPSSRIPAVGVFISALLLASLCFSYFLEIVGHVLEPHPVQLPLLPVVVGAVSLLWKTLLFVLNWDQLQDGRIESCKQIKQDVPTVCVGEESQGQVEAKHVQPNTRSAAHQSLVFCNPGASSTPRAENQQKQQHIQSRAAGLSSERGSEHNQSQEQADASNPSSSSSACPLPSVFLIQGLFTSLLALTHSLLMLLVVPQLRHTSGVHRVLVYLDPGFSLLAVITLITTTAPQVYRHGLLLLQASPPHLNLADLRGRIARVPGVQEVHDLHVWQLTQSVMVASVHVHCCPGFPAHRCADVMSEVTAVLQDVGVSCCTVQPEFPSSPPLPVCSLSCGASCAASMCCSLLEDKAWTHLRPPAGDTLPLNTSFDQSLFEGEKQNGHSS